MRKSLQSLTWQIKYKERNMRAIVVFSLLFMKWGKKCNLNYSISFLFFYCTSRVWNRKYIRKVVSKQGFFMILSKLTRRIHRHNRDYKSLWWSVSHLNLFLLSSWNEIISQKWIFFLKKKTQRKVIANVRLRGQSKCGKRGKERNNKYIGKIIKGPRWGNFTSQWI